MNNRPTQIIAICGGSASGKTELARKFISTSIVTIDHFYKDISEITQREDGTYDFDHPTSVDLEACKQVCLRLASGKDAVAPVYDMKTGHRAGTQLIAAPKNNIVVVEGIFSFHSPLQEISTLKIFIDTPIDQRMARRLRRDIERGRSELETIKHSLYVEEAYSRYVEPMRVLADLVLMGEEIKGGFVL